MYKWAQHLNLKIVVIHRKKKSSELISFSNINKNYFLLFFFVYFRRHTINIQKPLIPIDGINLSRRPSFNNGRRLSFQQQEITESSKSKTNLRNFYVFFVLLFLFIFLAVVYSFIRMIKNQAS
jgi:hypothetical protein